MSARTLVPELLSPRSSCSAFTSQYTYWTGIDRFSPNSSRSAATLSALAASPSSQAAIVEQSLTIYRSLLVGGLSGPRRILAGTTPPEVAASENEVRPGRKRPQRPAAQRLAEARGAARRAIARELAAPVPEAPVETPLTAYQLRAAGSIYTFAFPVADLPSKGSDACLCSSGEAFANCHLEDFQKALAAGITQQG